MAALLDIFAFLSVLLRAITLASEALTIGGVIFLLAIAKQDAQAALHRRLSAILIWSSALLAASQLGYVGTNGAILAASTNLTWVQVGGAGFCVAGALIVAGAGVIGFFARSQQAKFICPAGCILILAGAVMTSHSMARLEYRWALGPLTLTHHLASAAWIGCMPYLLVSLRRAPSVAVGNVIVGRFSRMAVFSVAALVGAGLMMSLIYTQSVGAWSGTTYGIMVLSKVFLTGLVMILGGLNSRIVAAVRKNIIDIPLRLRRFAEVEVGIGFTIIFAAASLTSSPPAVDVQPDRVSIPEIAQRLSPRWPRMQTPSVNELSPATPLNIASNSALASFVPGQLTHPNTPADIAWSEYNHHWAGLIVMAIGILSCAAYRVRWARYWPLAFAGLGIFLLVRADSENWPLGPRGFWESFQVAEVAQHRLFVLLLMAFAVFELGVQTSRIRIERAGLVFPMVCAFGGALLLTHSHSLGNIKEEFLAELSHIPLALLAVIAGWSRWLEVRLWREPAQIAVLRFVRWTWPVCFILMGAILLNYREA